MKDLIFVKDMMLVRDKRLGFVQDIMLVRDKRSGFCEGYDAGQR